MVSASALPRSRPTRFVLGILIGAVLLVLTVSRVDLGTTVGVVASASATWLALGVGVVLVDLLIRGARWRALLAGVGANEPPRLPLAIAYLTIGYFANVLLPARLGDLARAHLAGRSFRLGRLAVLGTIVVERVADGATMLVMAIAASALVAGVATVRTLVGIGLVLAASGLAVLAVGWWLTARTRLGTTGLGRRITELASRLALGTAALRTPAGATAIGVATLAAAATAILTAWMVARAVGIELSAPQAVLFMSAIALSLAIPAAPASLGTYEFVGVVVLTSLGYGPEQSLATMILLRAVSTFPSIGLGLISTWLLHLRPAAILGSSAASA